jgi:hypothetical protein
VVTVGLLSLVCGLVTALVVTAMHAHPLVVFGMAGTVTSTSFGIAMAILTYVKRGP